MSKAFGLSLLTFSAAVAFALAPNPFQQTRVALADGPNNDFVTDGSKLLSPLSFFQADTSWRINTGETGSAAITSITPDFIGPADAGIDDTTGWTEAYNAGDSSGTDDGAVKIPFGTNVSFNGKSYDSVFIQSNTYFTFGDDSWNYESLTFDMPPIPGVHICSGDHSFQRVLYKEEEGDIRVRYEGTNDTEGATGDPNIVYEAVFYPEENYVDVHVGINVACDGNTLNPEFRGIQADGYVLHGSTGTWPIADEPDLVYQWQVSDDGESSWTNILDATSLDFTLTSDQVGKYVRLGVIENDDVEVFSNDTGAIQEPHVITTCEQLESMDTDFGPFSYRDVYQLGGTINCGDTDVHPLNWETFFDGVFDGRGNTIRGLTIDSEDGNVGLFGRVQGGTIENITFDTVTVNGDHSVGSLIGEANSDASNLTISNIHVTGGHITSANGDSGGLVGYWDVGSSQGIGDSLVDSSFQGTVSSGENNVGGLIGDAFAQQDRLSIERCSTDVTASSDSGNIGGLIGTAENRSQSIFIDQSYVSGTINGEGDTDVGGLIGYAVFGNGDDQVLVRGLQVTDSYANATVTGFTNTGGLIGESLLVDTSDPQIIAFIDLLRTYAAGTIHGATQTGGLLGYTDEINGGNSIQVEQSFAASNLTNGEGSYGAIIGVAGNDDDEDDVLPVLSNDHYDRDRINNNYCDAVNLLGGCTAENIEGGATGFFFDSSNAPMNAWDFENVWETLDSDYPILAALTYATPPSVFSGEGPDSIERTSATISADLTGSGSGTVTEEGFEYGTDTHYGGTVSNTAEAFDIGGYTLTLTDLQCHTEYHYRGYAIGAVTGYGSDRTFTTKNCSSGGYIAPNLPGLSSDSSDVGSGSSGSDSSSSTETTKTSSNVTSSATHSHDTFTGHEVAEESGKTGPSPFDMTTEPISNVAPGWYIRGNNYDTVYFVVADGKRRPFWDIKTFFTYANSWDDVVWVTDATLATLPLTDPMLPKSGVVLVKVSSDATTYAVSLSNVLQAIPDEQTAITLYGSNWADNVIDVDPTIMKWFTVGSPLTTKDSIDKTILKTRTQLAH